MLFHSITTFTAMGFLVEEFSFSKTVSAQKAAVLRTLLYFDIFKHPLTEIELFQLLNEKIFKYEEITLAISDLSKNGLIQFEGGYYFLNPDQSVVQRRIEGEVNARKSLKVAVRFSKLIAGFPFVRGIALSGSLSKNYMDNNSDIDYFIITAPERMWVARTLLVLFKKSFLLNSHKYFCLNYFLSEDTLEVPDKNIFTATEISFLIPTYNYSLYTDFMNSNEWSKKFLPNFPLRQPNFLIKENKYFFKAIFEKILSGKVGEKFEKYFFLITLKHRKKKFKHFDKFIFDLRMRSKKNAAKHHPLGFQEKVLKLYSEKIETFERVHNISLHEEDIVYA